jgi:hypothetical protein
VLAERRRLPELPAEPAAQTHRCLVDHACTVPPSGSGSA